MVELQTRCRWLTKRDVAWRLVKNCELSTVNQAVAVTSKPTPTNATFPSGGEHRQLARHGDHRAGRVPQDAILLEQACDDVAGLELPGAPVRDGSGAEVHAHLQSR